MSATRRARASRTAAPPRDTAPEQRSATYPVREERALVGARLRGLRQARGLSLEQVAQAIGVNKSFVSKLERNFVQPSIATLLRYCDAVGIRPGLLFDPPPANLVRRSERRKIDLGGEGLSEELISGDGQDQVMVLLTAIAPGGGSGPEPYTLRSTADLIHVLTGRLEVTVDSDTYMLKPGDTLTFPPTLPHRFRNPSATEVTRTFWVISPPP
ncbi:MAG: helix-turn-helix transcriptional regulator [Acidisphaera sp.]|nr:helix-turn-helix transcriptional regulator [Acidisphaera sp.]